MSESSSSSSSSLTPTGTQSPRSLVMLEERQQRQQRDIALLRAHLKRKPQAVLPPSAPDHNHDHAPSKTKPRRYLSLVRLILIDVPLLLLCSTAGAVYFTSHIYHNYYIRMFDASLRAFDNRQLMKEFTYYERDCTIQDISSRHGEGLLLDESTHTPKEAVSNIMRHGTSIIPNILNTHAMVDLRKYILKKNNRLTRAEKIPLSQNKRRASFAMDATDDETISTALNQIGTNEYLKKILQNLLGTTDPAVTEITAITAYEGAEDQVWHPDVKPDGNGLKFARTYSHSYSLFIPLQDTTADMGATTLCPGTHYCANWVYDLCKREGFQATDASPDDEIWHAGHGTLLNQQMWHRGAGHVKGPPRVVFIVSFIGPPDETRQLQRGTYFHHKWNMWGHTFRDLKDAQVSMAKPFSVLRALHFWKPSSRNFGYDLISSAIMRIANQQQGMTSYEAKQFKKKIASKVLPQWLQGDVNKEADFPWKDYLEETMVKVKRFVYGINAAVLGLYGMILGIICVVQRSIGPAKAPLRRTLLTHGLPALVLYASMNHVAQTPWGRQISSGRFLRPPFTNELSQYATPTTTTTLPTRFDVLVGTRFDATYLGAYNDWLKYHPGNVEFEESIAHCSRMPVALDDVCIDNLLLSSNSRSRILLQDWTTGDWIYQTNPRAFAHSELRKIRYPIVERLVAKMNRLLAYTRFDATANPHQVLYKTWLQRLQGLKDEILLLGSQRRKVSSSSSGLLLALRKSSRLAIKSSLPPLPSMDVTSSAGVAVPRDDSLRRLPPPPRFQKGDIVSVHYNEAATSSETKPLFYQGIVDFVTDDYWIDVMYDDGDYEENVATRLVSHHVPLEEHAFVSYTPKKEKPAQKASVKRVHASGRIDVQLLDKKNDGDVYSYVHPAKIARLEVS